MFYIIHNKRKYYLKCSVNLWLILYFVFKVFKLVNIFTCGKNNFEQKKAILYIFFYHKKNAIHLFDAMVNKHLFRTFVNLLLLYRNQDKN